MISATPNSVRWDQVNRVTYRFQALNFQSDVLEALVLNSPPLSRRSRRKPIIRIADSTENRIEFLQASSLERRSQSFDEDISNRSKQEAKFYEKSRVSHDRYASGRAEVSNLVSKGTEKSISGRTTDSKGLLESVTASSTTDDVTEFDESVGDKERESKARSDDGDVINGDVINGEDDEDLESKSKEYLIQLVKELRSELRMRNRIDMDSSQCSRVEDDPREDVSECCSPCKCVGASSDNNTENTCFGRKVLGPTFTSSLSCQDFLTTNMKQLESEVIRTRKIASMFENEISGLKTKFSSILGKVNDTAVHNNTAAKIQRNNAPHINIVKSTEQDFHRDSSSMVDLERYQGKVETCYHRNIPSDT